MTSGDGFGRVLRELQVQASAPPIVMLARLGFVCCLIALPILSWLPGDELVRTSVGGYAEHAVAYLGTTIVMGLAVQRRIRLELQCTLLASYAAILETGQLYFPGRNASVRDFAFSAAGIILGGLLLRIMRIRLNA